MLGIGSFGDHFSIDQAKKGALGDSKPDKDFSDELKKMMKLIDDSFDIVDHSTQTGHDLGHIRRDL
jgi:hypothetical protein